MKKIVAAIFILLILTLVGLCACDKTEFSDEIVSISVREFSDVYFVGDEVVFENIVFDYTYKDGRTGTKIADASMVNGVSTANAGEFTATLTYGGKSAEFVYCVGGTLVYAADEGGYISGRANQLVAYGGTGTYVEAIPYEGYVFESWSDGVTETTRRETAVTEWKNYTAAFSRIQCIINYYSEDDVLLRSETLDYGESYYEFQAPTGSQIDGYYNKTTGDLIVSDTARVSMDIEVRYKPLQLTVSYTGGTEAIRVFDYGSGLTFPEAVPPSGQVLLNWEDDEGIIYSEGFVLTEALNLFAVFSTEAHSVTLISNSQVLSILEIPHGYPLGLIGEPVLEHKQFMRWENESGQEVGADTLIYEDMTLNAVWTDKYYTITLYLNGGEFENSSYSLLSGSIIEAYQTGPTRFGYTFEGWYADSDYSAEFIFGNAINSNTDIYVKWQPCSVVVRYVYMYGSIEKTEYHSFGENLELLCLARTEYDFLGWYTEQNFTNIFEDGSAIGSLSLVLYAKWDIKKFNVQLSPLTGGSIVILNSLPINYGGTLRYRVVPAAGHNAVTVNINSYTLSITQTGTFERSFTNVTTDIVLSAVFERFSLSVTINTGTGGTASPTGVTSVLYGDDLTVDIMPDTGYLVGTVKVNQVTRTVTNNMLVVENVTTSLTVNIQFVIKYLTVSVELENASSSLSSGTADVIEGNGLSVTINAGTNYSLLYVRYREVPGGTIHTVAITDPDKKTATVTLVDIRNNIVIEAVARISEGSVTASAEAGGAISPSGITQVDFDEQILFTITPSTGHRILDVTLNGVSLGAVAEYNYFPQLPGGDTVIAYFELIPYYIQASVLGNGSISPSGVSVVRYGEDASYLITADANYHIDYLLIDDVRVECSGKSAEYQFQNIIGGHTIRAVFAIDTYSVTINLEGNGRFSLGTGAGAIIIASSGIFNAEHGTALYIYANTGNYISALSVNGTPGDPSLLVGGYIGQIVQNMTIEAEFSVKTYTIACEIIGSGTLTAPSTVLHGDSVLIEFTPETGHRFKKLFVMGSEVTPTNNSYLIVNVTGNVTVTVQFEIIVLTISVTTSTGGSAENITSVNYGESAVITLIAEEHHHIASITASYGDYSAAEGLTEYEITVSSMTSDFVLHAVFALDTYAIAFNIGSGGSLQLPSGAYYTGNFELEVEFGATVSYYIAADEGKQIASVILDGESSVISTLVHFENVAETHTVAVTFVPKTYNITAMVTGGGNGTIGLSQSTVQHGGSVTVTLYPAAGYKVGTFKINGVAVSVSGNNYTINNITSNITINVSFVLS